LSFFFSSRRRHTRFSRDWSSDVCSSDLANGGTFWINGEQLPSPNWINPGWKPQVTEGWGNKQDQEIAWEDEELYWTREPVSIPLKKGWNTVIFKVPGKNGYQNWMFTFAPLDTQPIKYSTSIKN